VTAAAEVDFTRKWRVMATVATGVLLATIDGSIVNVALPTMVEDLDTTFPVIQWVSLGYLLTLATLTLGTGRLGDILGKKRIYTSGFAVFTVMSALCGLSPSVGALIGFRVAQAVGATMILSLGAAILTDAFPPQERGKALGWIGTAVSVGIVTGPVVGGLLISAFSWRAIFLVNIPVGMVGTVMALRHVPDVRPAGGRRMDFAGAGLLSVSLLALSLGLTLGQDRGFASAPILAAFAVATAGLTAFVLVELRSASPMLDLRLFRNPLLTVSIVTGWLAFMSLSSLFLVLPFYLEEVLGYGVRETGLLLAAGPVVLGLVAPLSGTLSDRTGVRRLALAGLGILALSYVGLQSLSTDTAWWHYALLAVPLGIGSGVFQSPNNSAIMGSVPRGSSGLAAGLLTITRLLGQIVGVAVLGSLWAARVAARAGGLAGGDVTSAGPAALVGGMHDLFAVVAALMLTATALAAWALGRDQTGRRPAPAG
jgi:EmrB/QacA subfamily drug resistance transporter